MRAAMPEESSLVYTPSWAIAATCFVFIVVSLVAERTIYLIGHFLVKYKQTALQDAFDKVKEELMMVGFISIALTLGQGSITSICVPTKWTTKMLLCNRPSNDTSAEQSVTFEGKGLKEDRAATQASGACREGHSPFMLAESFHQLHILVFILAVVHVFYTVAIVALGMWSIHHWKVWEERAKTKEELSIQGGVRLTRDTTFMRAHIFDRWMSPRIFIYVVSFFRQFHSIVSESDYHTLRNGFIKNHMPSHTDFNFYKYIRRSLQDDFKYVVGISWGLWGYAILWLLVNVDGWESNVVITSVPLLLLLAIGTKMQHIITMMAIRFNNQNSITIGLPNVIPNNKLFWFSHPRFVLHCIHFILFQNALEVSFDIWAAISLPPDNCLYQHPGFLIGRLIIGIVAQVLCGVITLPIYALVCQMGSNVKRTIFEEHIQKAISKWRREARSRVRKAQRFGEGSSGNSPAPGDEPLQDTNQAVEMVLHHFPDT